MWRGNTRRSPLILFWTASTVDYWIFDNNIYMMITVFALSSMSFMCFARDISQLSIARCTADGFVDESPSWFCGSHAPFEGKSWRKLRHCPSLPNYLDYNGCNVNNDTLHYSNGFQRVLVVMCLNHPNDCCWLFVEIAIGGSIIVHVTGRTNAQGA